MNQLNAQKFEEFTTTKFLPFEKKVGIPGLLWKNGK